MSRLPSSSEESDSGTMPPLESDSDISNDIYDQDYICCICEDSWINSKSGKKWVQCACPGCNFCCPAGQSSRISSEYLSGDIWTPQTQKRTFFVNTVPRPVLLKLFNIVNRQRTFCHSTYQLCISNRKNRKNQVLFNKQQPHKKVKSKMLLF